MDGCYRWLVYGQYVCREISSSGSASAKLLDLYRLVIELSSSTARQGSLLTRRLRMVA